MYYHGESINVNVQATNNSNKTVKKIKISGIFFVLFIILNFKKFIKLINKKSNSNCRDNVIFDYTIQM
jgi:hypothetical protein